MARQFRIDPDMWWHIKAGDIILTTHHWPTTDPFSFTVVGQPWIACEWLSETLIACVSRIAGIRGLDALLIVLSAAIMIGIYVLGTLRSKNSKAGLLAAAILMPLAAQSFTLRPQMLGLIFLILTLIALELFREGKRNAIWFLPFLFLVWVNTHGSFTIGLGAIFVYWICGFIGFRLGQLEARPWSPNDRIRLSGVFLACLATLPLTPYGTRMAAYPFEVMFKLPMGVANVIEWRPIPFNESTGKLFLLLLLGALLAQVVLGLTWRLEEMALFLFGTLMACLHMRFLLVFVPFAAPLIATVFAQGISSYDKKKDHYVLNAAMIALVILGIGHWFPSNEELRRSVAENFPVGAVDYAKSHAVPGPMFNSYGFGGYLIWSRWPEQKIFIDGRSDPFERGGVLADYLYITELRPGALAVLNGYGVRSCLLERNAPLASALTASPDWQRVYSDNVAVLLVRRNSNEKSTVAN
jgi:hypothetical protein